MSNQTDDAPEGFKMTELGLLPEDWRVASLGDVFHEVDVRVSEFTRGDARKFPVLSLTKNHGLMLQSQRFGKRIALDDVSDYKVVKRDDIVYNPYVIWEGAIHKLARFDYGLVSPVYPVLETDLKRAVPHFLDSILRTPLAIANYNRFAAGAVNRRRSIRKTDFMTIRVPLPPLHEQKAIAGVLSTIQDAIEAQDKVIAASRDLKKSLMRHLFTYGPVPVAEAESVLLKEIEIGPMPDHWEIVSLGDVAAVNYGKSNPKTEGDIPVVGSGGIYAKTRSALTDYPTLVIGRKGTAGEVWLCEDPCWPSDTTFYLAWKRELNVKYVFAFMSSHKLSGEHAKTTLPSLQKHELQNSLLPIAPICEQMEIAHILSSVDAKTEAEEKRKLSLQTLFRTILHNLMTGKVRVKDMEGIKA